jgi:uncharacterized RDD family membrane protein YckC
MEWYYVQDGKRNGPIGDDELQSLVSTGVIDREDLVWRKGMSGWQKYGEIDEQEADRPQYFKCAECDRLFPADEMVQYMGQRVCAACKPTFFQRVKEGARLPGMMHYGGFWIRFVAKFVDGFILGIANLAIQTGLTFALIRSETGTPSFGVSLLILFLELSIAVGYTTFFLGKFAATPGKMALGLQVVTPEGGRVSYMRAFGRYFAELLSGMLLMIGYIMAAFDEEKRALHDRICSTRVIRK